MGTPDKQVLVLLPFDRDREGLRDIPPGYHLHWMTDDRLSWTDPSVAFDIVAYTERCSQYIEDNGIDAVFCSHEPANLVAGVLCERHGLPGPSLDAMFVCNHKYYSRAMENDPIWWDHIDLATGRWGKLEPTFPCYVKPPFLWQTLFQHRVDSPAQLDRILDTLRREMPPHTKPYYDFFRRYIDRRKYPLTQTEVLQVEEFIGHSDQHCVMGWCDADGTPHLWEVYDRTFYPGSHKAADVSAAPSRLPPAERRRVVAAAMDSVRAHRIRNGFWNVDLWLEDDRVIIIEVNGRAASVWHDLHLGTFGNSLFHAMLYLCCDQPERCRQESLCTDDACRDRVGGQFHAVTFGEGRAGDLLDYDFVRSLREPAVELFVDEDAMVRQVSGGGFWMARFHLFGTDWDALTRQADELRARMLTQPHHSPLRTVPPTPSDRP